MLRRLIQAFCLLALVIATSTFAGAQAQEQAKDPMFIYVAEWAVPRAQWGDMEKQEMEGEARMKKLVADGLVTGYGSFKNLVHQEGSSTHGSWYTANSMGNLMKALENIYATGTTTSPVQAASKHSDSILISRHYNGHSGNFQNAYLTGGTWLVKEGMEREWTELVEKNIVPIMEKLLQDNAIHMYVIDREYIHTKDPAVVEIVYFPVDAAGLDKARAAINAALEKTPTLGPAFGSMIQNTGHHDYLALVPRMSIK